MSMVTTQLTISTRAMYKNMPAAKANIAVEFWVNSPRTIPRMRPK